MAPPQPPAFSPPLMGSGLRQDNFSGVSESFSAEDEVSCQRAQSL